MNIRIKNQPSGWFFIVANNLNNKKRLKLNRRFLNIKSIIGESDRHLTQSIFVKLSLLSQLDHEHGFYR